MGFFTVTTCVRCLYFLYLSVLLAGKCHPRTDVGCHVDGEISTAHDFQCQVRNLNLKDAETQTKISIVITTCRLCVRGIFDRSETP